MSTQYFHLCSLTETHQIAQANEEKNAKFKAAFGIKDDYKDGSAFNQELQEMERMKKKEAKEKESRKQESRYEVSQPYIVYLEVLAFLV